MLKTYFVLLFIAITDITVATECTRKCSVSDKELDGCWSQSLDYFTESLLKSIHDYVSSLLHIDRWKTRHPSLTEKYATFETESLKRVLLSYNKLAANMDSPLNMSTLETFIMSLVNETALVKPHYKSESVKLPSYACPIPCDYYPKVWSALFFVTLTILLLFTLSLFLFYHLYFQKKMPSPYIFHKYKYKSAR